MSTSRRNFLACAGASALALAAKPACALINSGEIDGVRYSILHDETACIGCTACMDACREVNHVPEGVSRLEIIRTGPVGDPLDVEYFFFRKSCQHCDNPPCVEVCPTGASFVDKKTGIVDVNPDLCVGCKYCIFACPYRVRFINPVTKIIDKCDFCRHTNLKEGKQPACVEACPVKALTFGNLDDPKSELSLKIGKSTTYRYKEALGTEPKMYRIPKGQIRS